MSRPLASESDSLEAGSSRGFQDYLRWFLRRIWIFLIALVGGVFLGLYLYSVTPPTYQSVATIEIIRVKRDAADIAEAEKIRMSGAAEMLSASERLRLPQIFMWRRRKARSLPIVTTSCPPRSGFHGLPNTTILAEI